MALSDAEIQSRLDSVPEWIVEDDQLVRRFKFANFKDAFSFMTLVAEAAESMQHHPDWHNSYNLVAIHLSTHSADGITEADFELAKQIDQIVQSYKLDHAD